MIENPFQRTSAWIETQKSLVDKSIALLLNTWGLNVPLNQLNPFQKKQAGFVLETVMAAYGLSFEDGVLDTIVSGFYPHLDTLQGNMTDNHNSLAARILGDGISTAIKYAPVLVGGKELSQLSPLKVSLGQDQTKLTFQNPVAIWQLGIDFPKPPHYVTHQFEYKGEKYRGKKFVDACVASNNGGFVLIDTGHPCSQGCLFCTFQQGKIKTSQGNNAELEQVLNFVAESTGKITACLSSGSDLYAGRKIPTTFGPLLKIIDSLKTANPALKVELELELMPWEIHADYAVLRMIEQYYQKGYIKAINLNLETPLGVDRAEFMNSSSHGKALIPITGYQGDNRGYLETFQLLKDNFPSLQLAGLVLFGLKPPTLDWSDYTQLCLETVNLFAQNDIKVLFQPIKISSKTPLAQYPAVDIYWLTGAVLAAGMIHLKHCFDKKHRVGCVNGCDACDSSRSAYSLLKMNSVGTEIDSNLVYQLFQPWPKINNFLRQNL